MHDEQVREVAQDLTGQRQGLCPTETLDENDLAVGVDEEDAQQEGGETDGNTGSGTIAEDHVRPGLVDEGKAL